MPNRFLTSAELASANELLATIRESMEKLAEGDKELLFAYRRKIYKELTYDERTGPTARRKLKLIKRREQNGLCPICGEALPEKYAVLDRIRAVDGYVAENTRLIHQHCDIQTQASRGYA
jgi:hypothetical protein